jgi:hypothetical protein
VTGEPRPVITEQSSLNLLADHSRQRRILPLIEEHVPAVDRLRVDRHPFPGRGDRPDDRRVAGPAGAHRLPFPARNSTTTTSATTSRIANPNRHSGSGQIATQNPTQTAHTHSERTQLRRRVGALTG